MIIIRRKATRAPQVGDFVRCTEYGTAVIDTIASIDGRDTIFVQLWDGRGKKPRAFETRRAIVSRAEIEYLPFPVQTAVIRRRTLTR